MTSALNRPPHVQAVLMIGEHADYKYAIRLCTENIGLYSQHSRNTAEWWKAVRKHLRRMQKNHFETEHGYYQAITGECDEPTP